MEKLLTRDQFREQTLQRLKGHCAIPGCQAEATDAHHILNRNLWEDGGYYLSNGAPLCAFHHLRVEQGLITNWYLYDFLGQPKAWPSSLEPGRDYDTWGNQVVTAHFRRRGPLFEDEGCQKALRAGGILWKFA